MTWIIVERSRFCHTDSMKNSLVPILTMLLSAATWAAPVPRQGNPDRGLPLYSSYCAGCHGFEGQGDGPMAAGLERDSGVRPIDLSNPAFQDNLTDAQLMALIRDGGTTHRTGYMPAWGLTLTPGQMTDLVAFLRELRNPDRRASARAVNIQQVLERGRALFSLHCLACHGPEGRGDGPFMTNLDSHAADLSSGLLRKFNDLQLEELIKGGLEHSKIEHLQANWWNQTLSQVELQALVFFLRALPVQER